MVPPPWDVSSPVGELHHIEDIATLKQVAVSYGMITANYKNALTELRGKDEMAELHLLPLHRKGWQLVARMQWIMHADTKEIVPIVGGDGNYFVTNFAHWCASNLPGLTGQRLNEFLRRGGQVWSNGRRVERVGRAWELLTSPPADPVALVRAFVSRVRPAPPQVRARALTSPLSELVA